MSPTRRSEESASSASSSASAGPSPEGEPLPTTEAAPSAAPPAAAPSAPPVGGPPAAAERDFDITLRNNDNPKQEQIVIASGPSGDLAAQRAMRTHPGWTADHTRTQEHGTVPGSTI